MKRERERKKMIFPSKIKKYIPPTLVEKEREKEKKKKIVEHLLAVPVVHT